jgi:hypothetical protein
MSTRLMPYRDATWNNVSFSAQLLWTVSHICRSPDLDSDDSYACQEYKCFGKQADNHARDETWAVSVMPFLTVIWLRRKGTNRLYSR